MENWQQAGFGLYVHWPFCESKCPYCDFNSHVARSIDQAAWCSAYLAELDRAAAETPGRIVSSVFFGGGTPSLMAPETVAAILERVKTLWRPANDLEVTLEANPGSVEAGRFRAYRDAGVNRVSIGIQSLNADALRLLGRMHSAAEGQRAIEIARATFDRVSFDLIYARQHQTRADWEAELRAALAFETDHLSLYQLTIEDGTVFGARMQQGKLRGLPTEDAAADMYETTQDLCAAAGLPAYEVSNHARGGSESRHNLIYWRSGDYAAIGPGAHGRLTLGPHRVAFASHPAPGAWMKAVQTTGSGESERGLVPEADVIAERLMMGLRLAAGIDLERITGSGALPHLERKITELETDGLLRIADGTLTATDRGRMLLNAVLDQLVNG